MFVKWALKVDVRKRCLVGLCGSRSSAVEVSAAPSFHVPSAVLGSQHASTDGPEAFLSGQNQSLRLFFQLPQPKT